MEHGSVELVRMRGADLNRRLKALQAKRQISVSFIPSHETSFISYFPKNLHAELAVALGDRYAFLSPEKGGQADIVVLTVHGSDLSDNLWRMRDVLRKDALIATWLWDNHVAKTKNYRTVLAADFVFPSHGYMAGYLFNPLSVVAEHIPLCTAQWTIDEARKILDTNRDVPRKSKAFVNYVDYQFSWRSRLFQEMKERAPEAEVLLMDPKDRTRYFSKTPEQRLQEWLQYKATVILPVDKDLSTRLFDALLAGQVPVVPTSVKDFDHVISPKSQKELGIVRVTELNVDALNSAISRSLSVFDEMGEEGVRKRQEFVLKEHMLIHRISAMLASILEMGRNKTIVEGFGEFGFGLYVGQYE